MAWVQQLLTKLSSFFRIGASVDTQSRQWLIKTLDLLPKPFFLVDFENNRISFSNAAARRMMGMDYAENPASRAYGTMFSLYNMDGTLVPADQLPSARILRGEKILGEEFELSSRSGRYIIKVFSEDIPAMHGQPASALIVFQDITTVKTTENNLRRTQADLNRAIDIAQVGFWSVNTLTNETTLSDTLLLQFGLTTQTFDGSLPGVLKSIHPEDSVRVVEAIQNSIARGTAYHIEYRVVHPDGSVRWIEAKSGASNEMSEPNRFTGTTIDITQRVLDREKVNEARRIAENANQAKSQFLANMSHEIRTPLGAIMGFSALLKENGLAKPEREEFVAVIERNSAQLMRIIDDILDLSKVEAGMMLIENIEFSLPEILTDVTSLMAFKAREKGVNFRMQALTPLPSLVSCDPTRLRQILMNVIGNAIKFTEAGQVELRVSYREEHLDFEVEDTGRGISPEQAENLFKAFTQADASITRNYGGTGLGLVLTRSLTEALGGSFTLKNSQIGQGSTFAIRVRAQATSASRLSFGPDLEDMLVKPELPVGQLSGLRLLLVEDSPDNQALISIYLGRAGASVDIAADGAQGVKVALASDYDLILMDVQMPLMDGITSVKKLRSLNYAKPILALTAHAMKDERERCLAAGFSGFLSKPINRYELISTILEYK